MAGKTLGPNTRLELNTVKPGIGRGKLLATRSSIHSLSLP